MTNKKIVNSWNEWDPLKHVIVGRADGCCIPAPEPALDAKVPEDSDMKGQHGLLTSLPESTHWRKPVPSRSTMNMSVLPCLLKRWHQPATCNLTPRLSALKQRIFCLFASGRLGSAAIVTADAARCPALPSAPRPQHHKIRLWRAIQPRVPVLCVYPYSSSQSATTHHH